MPKKTGSKGQVVIRGYEPPDLEACRRLWAELTAWHRQIYEDPTIGGEDPGRLFDGHLAKCGKESIWVAEVGGRIVGMAGLEVGDDGPELEPVVVLAPHRRRGIGRELVEAVVAAARARGHRELHVRPVARNEAAIRFFHGLGFDTLGHLQMFADFRPRDRQPWKKGERLAGQDFRV